MTSPVPPRKNVGFGRAAGGCALVAALMVLVLLGALQAIAFFWTRLDQRRFPWGYPESRRPTLVGTWVGTLVTGGGARRGLLVEIRLVPVLITSRRGKVRVRGGREAKLEGEVRLCAAPGHVQGFTANGDTQDDRAASRFVLSLYPAEDVQEPGLAPSHLRGTWGGGDALDFEVDLYLRQGSAAISSTDDPDTGRPARAETKRADEATFRALCASLAR